MSESPEDLERRRRLVELRNQLAEISGGEDLSGPAGEGRTLEMEVAILERMAAFATGPTTTGLRRLLEKGCDMPDPATLFDRFSSFDPGAARAGGVS